MSACCTETVHARDCHCWIRAACVLCGSQRSRRSDSSGVTRCVNSDACMKRCGGPQMFYVRMGEISHAH
jgi:hypothetical protein